MEELGKKTLQEPRIKFENVSKIFETRSQEIVAVKDYSMEVLTGEFVSIIGPSGCGKSTLIRMLDGIIKPTEGNIYLDGNQVNEEGKMPKETLRKMGFIFQQPNLLPWYTVRENVALPLRVFGLSGETWEKRVDELLELVGLSKSGQLFPYEISGGMLQRAGVVRAMVHDPEILLMDEPFGALDELTREQLNMELLEIWKETKKTIIFITHNVEEAVLLSSRIYVMGTQPGRLVSTVNIDLPRPRSLKMITQPEFIGYKQKLTKLIGDLDLSKIK